MTTETITAKLIPADASLPVRDVKIPADSEGSYKALSRMVGGWIETIAHPTRSDVSPYFNEDGKNINLPRNERATKLLAASMFPTDYIAGDMVLTGFEMSTGETVTLPADFTL